MAYSYAHWCQDGHVRIGHNDEKQDEMCPLCRANAKIDRLEDALHRIESWSRAYPLEVFPEPDFKKVAELLKAGGVTLDAVSASNMRHVVEGVGKIAREALNQP